MGKFPTHFVKATLLDAKRPGVTAATSGLLDTILFKTEVDLEFLLTGGTGDHAGL